MTPEQILSVKPRILTQKQREFYFENGYILLEKILPDSWVERLRAATDEMVDKSRKVAKSDAVWDIDRGHSRENPRLRRLSSMNDHHPTFWKYASAANSPLPDAIADLVGPDVKFHQSKLNFKWSKGGDEVKWHQDISFWPHTNYSPCTAGTYVF
ncbi:MAG: phytanoyl-CoA dioxygenase family protein, partial [Bradyrhizobium sp.]